MADGFASIFSFLWKQVEPWLRGIWSIVRKQAWLFVAFVLGVVTPISWAINYWAEASYFLLEETKRMFQTSKALGVGSAGSFWSALSEGAALMNCIVALDYAIAIGTTLFGFATFIAVAKGLVWLYKLIPFKMT